MNALFMSHDLFSINMYSR